MFQINKTIEIIKKFKTIPYLIKLLFESNNNWLKITLILIVNLMVIILDYIERNYNLIKERMILQMENSIKFGRTLIDTELDVGILSFVIKPIIKTFYDYWAKNEAKIGTLKQISITLDTGKELVINGNSEDKFNQLVEENFPNYLRADQISYQCNKFHKNYKKLIEITKATFVNYLKQVKIFLNVEENVNNYGELSRAAFKTKQLAKETLSRQLEYTNQCISLIEEDPSILSFSIGRKIILKALRKGLEGTKTEFFNSIDETYD
jgi:hypothetical protein